MMEMGLKCPICGKQMTQKTYEGVDIYYCPDRQGIWVPRDGLKSIVGRKIEIVKGAWKETERKSGFFENGTRINCPVCGVQCKELNYSYSSGVFVDRCPNNHGVWLDKSELEKIQDFVEIWDKRVPEILKNLKLNEVGLNKEGGEKQEPAITRNRLIRNSIFWLMVLFIGIIVAIIFRVVSQK